MGGWGELNPVLFWIFGIVLTLQSPLTTTLIHDGRHGCIDCCSQDDGSRSSQRWLPQNSASHGRLHQLENAATQLERRKRPGETTVFQFDHISVYICYICLEIL